MAVRTELTLDEFLQMEETKPYREYVCGEVVRKPMPNRRHSAIQVFFGAVLFQFLTLNRLGRVLTEFRCIFGPAGGQRTYVPDRSVVAEGRLTDEDYLYGPPDLAIEILSPRQHRGHFLSKIHFYLLNGVRLVWVVDPSNRTVTVMTPGEEARILRSGDTLDGGNVLPGFSVTVGDIFAQMQF